jgi:hypothetical protein
VAPLSEIKRRLGPSSGFEAEGPSYQLFAAKHGVFTINGRYIYESQQLDASRALGLASNHSEILRDTQYTAYLTFDGASQNYDGFGRSAADNNTFRVFAWVAY